MWSCAQPRGCRSGPCAFCCKVSPAMPCAPGRGSPGTWRARPARCCTPSGSSPGSTGSPATPARPPRPLDASAASSRAARCGTGAASASPRRVLRTTVGPFAGGSVRCEQAPVPSRAHDRSPPWGCCLHASFPVPPCSKASVPARAPTSRPFAPAGARRLALRCGRRLPRSTQARQSTRRDAPRGCSWPRQAEYLQDVQALPRGLYARGAAAARSRVRASLLVPLFDAAGRGAGVARWACRARGAAPAPDRPFAVLELAVARADPYGMLGLYLWLRDRLSVRAPPPRPRRQSVKPAAPAWGGSASAWAGGRHAFASSQKSIRRARKGAGGSAKARAEACGATAASCSGSPRPARALARVASCDAVQTRTAVTPRPARV